MAIDQLTKLWVVARLEGRDVIELLGGLLKLNVIRNPGAAFSLGTSSTWVFTAIATVVAVVVIRYSRRLTSVWWAIALGALLGGAIGNLIDRIFRAPGTFRGAVVDWIEFPNFPVFNLADSALTVAAVAIALLSVFGVEMARDSTPEPSDDPEGSDTDARD